MDKMLIISYIAGVIGMLVHPIKRKLEGESTSDIVTYFKGNATRSVMAVMSMIGLVGGLNFVDLCAAVPAVAEGAAAVVASTGFACIMKVATAAFLIGYTADSVVNKDGGTK